MDWCLFVCNVYTRQLQCKLCKLLAGVSFKRLPWPRRVFAVASVSMPRPRLFRKSRICWTINSMATGKRHKIEIPLVCTIFIMPNAIFRWSDDMFCDDAIRPISIVVAFCELLRYIYIYYILRWMNSINCLNMNWITFHKVQLWIYIKWGNSMRSDSTESYENGKYLFCLFVLVCRMTASAYMKIMGEITLTNKSKRQLHAQYYSWSLSLIGYRSIYILMSLTKMRELCVSEKLYYLSSLQIKRYV